MFDCRRDISSIGHRDVSPVSPFAVHSFSLADEILQKYSMQAEGYYPFGTTTFLEERETEESVGPPKEKRPESPDININLELFLMLSDPYVSAEEKNKILSVSDKAGLVYGGQRLRIIERAAALRKTQFGRRHEVRIRQKIPVPYVPITKASSSFGKGDISRIKYPAMVFSEVIDKAQNAGVTFGGSGTGKVPVPVYIKDFEKNNRPYDIWEELPEEAATSEKAVIDNTYKDVPEMITDTEVGIPVFDTVIESILPGAEIIHVKDNAESAEAEYRQLTPGKTGRTLGKLVGDLFGNLASLIRIESVNGKASQNKASERPLSAEKDLRQESHQKGNIRTAVAGKRAAGSSVTTDSAGNRSVKPGDATVIGNKSIKPGDATVIGSKTIKPGDATVTESKTIKPGDATVIESKTIKPGDATVIREKTINPDDPIIVGNKMTTSDAATVIEALKEKPEDTESIVENPSEVLSEEKQEIQEKQKTAPEGMLPGAEIIYVKENAEAAEAENSLTPSGNADRYIKELTEDVASLIQKEPLGSKALQTGKTAGSFAVDKKHRAELSVPGAEIIYAKDGTGTTKDSETAEAGKSPAVAERVFEKLTERIAEERILPGSGQQPGQNHGKVWSTGQNPEGVIPGAEIIYAEDGTETTKDSETAEGSKSPAVAERVFEKLTERIAEERILPESGQQPGQKPEEHLSTGQKPERAISESAILKSMIPESTNPERIPEGVIPGAEIIYAEDGTETTKAPKEADVRKAPEMTDRLFEKLAESIAEERILPGSGQQPGQKQESVIPGAEIIYEKEKGSPEERRAERSQEEQESISILAKSLVNTVRSTAGMKFLREEIRRSGIRMGHTSGNMPAKAAGRRIAPTSAADSYTDSITGETLSDITVSPFLTENGQPLAFEETAYSPYGAVNIEYADTVANLSREIQNAVNAGSFQRQNGAGFIDPGNFDDSFDPFESSSTAAFAEEVRKELLTQGPSVTYQNPYFMGAGSDMTYRERHRDSEQTPGNQEQRTQQPVRISDAELRRSADKIFNMIKDKVRLERRSMGLN